MAVLKQLDILTAGGQPWNKDVAASRGKYFAYAATMAVYIYKYQKKSKTYLLHSVVAQFKNTVTCIAWHPKNLEFLAIASTDPLILVWNISQHATIAILSSCYAIPRHIFWHGDNFDGILYMEDKGPVYAWKSCLTKTDTQVWKTVPLKEIPTFLAEVTHVRWHPTVFGKLAFGHSNGTISLYVQGRKAIRHLPIDEDKAGNSVTALEWDSLSANYLLVVTGHQKMSLLDCNEQSAIIMTYTPPSKAISLQTVAWIPSAPGMFLSGDKEAGVIRLWSVSQASPLESIRLKETGIQSLCVLGSYEAMDGKETRAPLKNDKGYCTPKTKVLLLFADGGVGVYDLFQRKWIFLKEMGHVETIFDCHFHPDDCDLLATASFDGTIKVWNLASMTPEHTSPGDESIIYGISWAPKNLNCIAAATSKNGVIIWDIQKGVIVKRLPHKDEKGNVTCFYCVSWNQKDARKIVVGGSNGQCIVYQADGLLVCNFDHPGTVYGCDWHPSNESILATACDDHEVRVYCVTTGIVQPLKVLSGHTGKVFRVKWSPLRDSFLCSTSDDCTLRVWDYSTATNVRTLTGHTQKVRGLIWCYELAHIIISGSWDSTIRIWDLRDGQCIDVVEDHAADVYGLACHPQRPFLLVSSSRDSTVRFWSMISLVSTAYAQSFLGREWKDIFATPVDYNRNSLDQPLLCGPMSTKLYFTLSKMQDNEDQKEVLPLLSHFFCDSPIVSNLYDLVCILQNHDVSSLSPVYVKGIQHTKHITKFQVSKCQQLELVKMNRFGSGGIGAPTRDESLNQAAELYLLMGNLRKYCELKVELDEWKDALIVAPGVSHDYWQKLLKRYANNFVDKNSLHAVPYLVATDNKMDVARLLQDNGQLHEALTVASSEWNIARSCACPSTNSDQIGCGDRSSLLQVCVDGLARSMLTEGKPVHAACYYLCINDVRNAVETLIRGHEIETAISVGRMQKLGGCLMQAAAKYLAWKCTKSGNWDLALDALLTLGEGAEMNVAQLCAHCPLSLPEKNLLYNKAGFPSVDYCLSHAQEAEKEDNKIRQTVKYYLLSHEPEPGLKLGLSFVRAVMSRDEWRLVEIWDVVKLLTYTRTEILQNEACVILAKELQLYASYLGALEAIHRGFKPVVKPLFSHAIKYLKKLPDVALPLTIEQLTSELHVWMLSQKNHSLVEEHQQVFDDLMKKLTGFGDQEGESKETLVTGSNLPRHSDQHRSFFTGQAIKGPVFFLEDGQSVISLNDALMWAKVNAFSPLETNRLINPF